jgi:hypothetical protein
MGARTDVLLWAHRVVGKREPQPHQLLDIKPDAGLEEAQAAFHRIAKLAHPDLHRALEPKELELVTAAYARCAAAYQDFRTQRMQGGKPKPVRDVGQSPPQARPPAAAPAPSPGPSPPKPADDKGPAGAMTSKALVYYRKAELALRRGDLRGAVMQLKLAIAADPLSGFLRSALAQVEAEVSKNP